VQGEIGNWDSGWYHLTIEQKVVGEIQHKPEYPRIDAGLDFYYHPPPPYEEYGINLVTTVWHNEKTLDEYLDYDWFVKSFDLHNWPILGPTPEWTNNELQNDYFIWDMFPFIDYDPVEVGAWKGSNNHLRSRQYAHFVFTQAQLPWPINDSFRVMYSNSNKLAKGQITRAYENLGSFSGQATIVMYGYQRFEKQVVPPPQPPVIFAPDFDIFFISNHDNDEYRYYSMKFYFDDEYDIDVYAWEENPVPISGLGYVPPGSGPLYNYFDPEAPVGAIFDWRSEMVAFKEWDEEPALLHHIYGNYEIFPVGG
jgi:hypothetical protein